MEQEKSVFNIINEIDKNILYQQNRMQEYYNGDFCCELGYRDAKLKIKELLQQRKQILKMNKKYCLSNFTQKNLFFRKNVNLTKLKDL